MVFAQTERVAQDLALAKRACEELQSGVTTCLGGLVDALNGLFLSFARRRLFHPKDSEDVVQSFWEELMNAKAICAYAQWSEHRASLRTYLFGILNQRIIDANRRISADKEVHQGKEGIENREESGPTPHNGLEQASTKVMRHRLVHETLSKLSEDSPHDASLIRLHLEGFSYAQMAERLFAGQDVSPKELRRKTDAIKKKFTREPTGSLAKFKAALKQIMQARGLRYEDI